MAASSPPLRNGVHFPPLPISSTPKSPTPTFFNSLPTPRFPKPRLHTLTLQNGTFLASRPRVSSSGNAQPFSPGGDDHRGALAPEPGFLEFLTSERVKVVIMVGLALVLCSIDRVVMSVAIVPLSLSHGWSRSFAGFVQSSFLWGYLVTPIAGGALVDYYGGKTVFAWGVALWSLATFLTPWAAESSLWALVANRAMVGMAEGVALPCMNSVISRWFPQVERARAVGIAMAGFTLGNAVGLVLSPILMSQAGIFGPFVIFGLSGLLWVLVWLSATSSTPERSPQISMFELNYILKKRPQTIQSSGDNKTIQSSGDSKARSKVIPPFRMLLSKLPTWAIIVANAMHAWGFFVILSWMPIYFNSVKMASLSSFTSFCCLMGSMEILRSAVVTFINALQVYHVELRQAAWFSAVPWSVMAVIGYFAGASSDFLIHSGTSITATRKIMQSIGFIGPSIALIGLTAAKNPTIASAWLSLAVGLKSFSHSGFLVNIQEIAPEYTGVLNGIISQLWCCLSSLTLQLHSYFILIEGAGYTARLSTTAGTLAAIIGTVGAGYFVELVGSFKGFLWLTSVLYILAAVFWLLFSTADRLKFEEADNKSESI
ncbi:LOW QUALITY PROTEIN: hypothetical protein V2J09_006337 [Rumex salicifolius]